VHPLAGAAPSGPNQTVYGLSDTANRSVRRLAIQARFFLGRRWPSGIPSARAFCLREPGVRLSALEMVLTRVLSLECFLNSLTSARVQARRTTRFLLATVLAITFSSLLAGSDSTTFWRAGDSGEAHNAMQPHWSIRRNALTGYYKKDSSNGGALRT
jgi:hypothetical protein